MLEQCLALAKFSMRSIKPARFHFRKEQSILMMRHFPKHGYKGKCYIMMASHYEMEIERDEQQIIEGEADIDRMAQ